MKKLKVIIFDLDGVLFDTMELIKQSMREQYPDFTDEMQKEMLMGNFFEERAKITVKKIEETDEQKKARQQKYSQIKSLIPMYSGAKELLTKLHSLNYILVLNTSAHGYNSIPMMENSNVKDLFDYLSTADVSKSKADKFHIIKEKYQVKEKEMLFITDTVGDIQEAKIAGVPTVGVTWGAHDRSFFEREEHENLIAVVDSFAKLENLILN